MELDPYFVQLAPLINFMFHYNRFLVHLFVSRYFILAVTGGTSKADGAETAVHGATDALELAGAGAAT